MIIHHVRWIRGLVVGTSSSLAHRLLHALQHRWVPEFWIRLYQSRRLTMKRIQQGFTLIELMIVVAIVGILAAIALPAYQDYIVRSKMSETMAAIAACKTSIAEYTSTKGTLPGNVTLSGCSTVPSQYMASLTSDGSVITAVSSSTGASTECTLTLDAGQRLSAPASARGPVAIRDARPSTCRRRSAANPLQRCNGPVVMPPAFSFAGLERMRHWQLERYRVSSRATGSAKWTTNSRWTSSFPRRRELRLSLDEQGARSGTASGDDDNRARIERC